MRILLDTHAFLWWLIGSRKLSLLSGLSNCGYDPDEILRWRQAWEADLNEHHLFADSQRAVRFREETDKRVPEHAPFQVFGLYRVCDPAKLARP